MNPIDKKEIFKIRNRVHRVLAESYSLYMLNLILGLILSAVWPLKVFQNSTFVDFSAFIIFFSSVLILWAQKSSEKLKTENLTKKSFMNGPYRYTRNPTNLGLFLLIVSFGMLVNSFFVVLFALIAFFVSRLFFIKKEEQLLEKKYGAPYLEYKKTVKF